MPTYTWKCECGFQADIIQSIGSYCDPKTKKTPWHCKKAMERMITREGGMNPLAGDRYYDGLFAIDGSPINSRTKHREYMKRNGLTMAEDFKGEWAKSAQERSARMTGNIGSNRAIIEREFTRLEQK